MKKGIWLTLLLIGLASFFIDKPVFSFMQSIQTRYLTSFLVWFSYLWTIVIVLLVITSLFMLEEKKAKWLKVMWLSFLASLIAVILIKFLFQIPRPIEHTLGEGFLTYSFPSAHAAVAFSIIPIIYIAFRKLKWFWIIFAVLVCVSRIYLGSHYLSDVIFGAILGYAIGNFFVRLEQKGKLSWTKKGHLS
jgi:membrane-associated phospholipid phosphatase